MSANDTTLHQQGVDISQRKHPCVLCQQRKVKCDRNEPCANCKKAGADCVSAASLPHRKRKRRFPEAELLARIRRYEHHLRNYGADIDAINRGEELSLPKSASRFKSNVSGSPSDIVHSRSLALHPVRSLSVPRSFRHVENNLSVAVNQEFQDAEEMLQGSSEDEMFKNPITRTYEDMSSDLDDLFFGSKPGVDLEAYHPSPVNIFRLWQAYLDNVDPLTKLFHAPTVQKKILEATADMENIPKSFEALMFGIYAAATMSMKDEECEQLFNQDRLTTLTKYQTASRYALINAGYLRSSDMVVLQAFVLFLLSSLQKTIDPRTLSCLTGVTVRIAERMGLSADGTAYSIPPFEVEMRRRLWWQIVLLDSRVAELSGAGTSVLTYPWTTKLPSNINDSDLFTDMRELPVERPGLSEMIFIRCRCEVANFIFERRSSGGSSVLEEAQIDEFERRMKGQYIAFCDQSVPLHFMSMTMARSALCKLRMGLRNSVFVSYRDNSLSEQEKEKFFILSLQMIKYHNTVTTEPLVRKFIWHAYSHFPAPAYIYLLCALRYRTTGELADQAWVELTESANRRNEHLKSEFYAKKRDSFIHYALANLTVKAWEARDAAYQKFSQSLPTPPFILQLRQQLASKKSSAATTPQDTSTPRSNTETFVNQFTPQFPMLNSDPALMGQMYDQSMLPGLLPNDMFSKGWEFWSDMIQGSEPAQGIDVIAPYNMY